MSPATFSQMASGTAPLTGSRSVADLATNALLAEAELTPKPGLVDQRGSGSHTDLTLNAMRASARAIAPYFELMASSGANAFSEADLRVQIAALGRAAESSMMSVTNGSNAHRGAIWILGLLVTGAARERGSVSAVVACAARLARLPDRPQPLPVTHGDMVRARHGVVWGARAEAEAGFPHAALVGLPALRAARAEGRAEAASHLYALLSIMAVLPDTCLLHRGGLEGLNFCRERATRVLAAGGPGIVSGDRELMQMDAGMVRRRLSPGGSADLLAATIFLDAYEHARSSDARHFGLWEGETHAGT